MADGVELNAGTGGVTAATDDCGAAGHTQVVKLAISTDGSATFIPATAAAGILVDQSDDATRDNGIMTVDNGGTFAVQVDGAALTALQLIDDAVFAEDVAAQAADKGFAVLAVRRDADTSLVDADNDYANLQVNANGALKVEAFSGEALPITDNSGSLTVDNGGTFAVQAASAGDVAHDAGDSGNPLKIGAFAETAPSGRTPVADGDRTNLIAGADGVLIVRPYCGLEDIVSGVDTDTDGSSTSVISAPGAGIRLYITSVIVKNTHASTDAYVDIRDGTAGSVLATIPAPAAGGAIVSFPVPLRLTSNTACAVDPSAGVTTIITTVVGFKAAV